MQDITITVHNVNTISLHRIHTTKISFASQYTIIHILIHSTKHINNMSVTLTITIKVTITLNNNSNNNITVAITITLIIAGIGSKIVIINIRKYNHNSY